MGPSEQDLISVDQIPKEWSDEAALASTLRAFRALRLFALQHDPDSFGSTYKREIELSDQRWKERLLKDTAFQIAASRSQLGLVRSDYTYVTGEWVGMVVSIRVDRGTTMGNEVYAVNGLFVHPSARGHGLGRRLMAQAFDVIKKDRRARFNKPVRVEIMVNRLNDVAIKLYRSCGFHIDREEPESLGGSMQSTLHMSRILEV